MNVQHPTSNFEWEKMEKHRKGELGPAVVPKEQDYGAARCGLRPVGAIGPTPRRECGKRAESSKLKVGDKG
jgi:hypothetical protein